MRLVRLKVKNFGRVGRAEVEFGSRLNLLYGPNELGKSTLAQAIRAALLLPITSKEKEQFQSWEGKECPQVDLVFQTEPQRYYRVEKSFGSGAASQAALSFSKDSHSFSVEERGRGVDGRLRELLQWGIAVPGKGAPKGLPSSFLTAVLLPDQNKTTALFDVKLDDDSDESARGLLTEALQTLGQDPVFQETLQRVQARVDEAFSSTGRRKGGEKSPYTRMRDRLGEAQKECDRWREELERTVSAQRRLATLGDELSDRAQEVEAGGSALAAAESRLTELEQRRTLDEELATALQRVEVYRQDRSELQACRERIQSLSVELQRIDELRQKARETLDSRALERENLNAQVLRLEGGQASQERRIRQGELQNQLNELETTCKELAGLQLDCARVRELEDQIVDLVEECEDLENALDALRTTEATKNGESDVWEWVCLWLRLSEAEKRAAEAATRHEKQKALVEQLADLEERARILEATEHPELPDPTVLSELRQLESSLQMAQGRLDVGLELALRPLQDMSVRVEVDGGAAREQKAVGELVLEADRELRVVIDSIGELLVRAGRKEERNELERLRDQWQSRVEPTLKTVGVSTLQELDALQQTRDGQVQEARALRSQVEALNEHGGDLEALALEALSRQRDADVLRQRLTDKPVDMLKQLSVEENVRTEGEAQERAQAADEALKQTRSALEKTATRLETQKTILQERRQSRRVLLDKLPANGDWKAFLAQAEPALLTALNEKVGLEGELAQLASAGDDQELQLKTRLTEAETHLTSAREQCEKQDGLRREAEGQLASEKGRSEILVRKVEEQQELQPVENKVAALKLKLADFPEADPELDARVTSLRQLLREAEGRLQTVEKEFLQARGALNQVGGDAVKQCHEEALAALTRLQDEQIDLELDYNAWKLLRDTMVEVDSEHGAHLGKALVPLINERFSELSGGFYETFELGSSLETKGIRVAGTRRQVNALSIGTQDQLCAIFRLSLAEQLQSAILLDDQLNYSDHDRMQWFAKFLREVSERTQVVVLTCRPLDYVRSDELPDPEEACRESEALRVVNLARMLVH